MSTVPPKGWVHSPDPDPTPSAIRSHPPAGPAGTRRKLRPVVGAAVIVVALVALGLGGVIPGYHLAEGPRWFPPVGGISERSAAAMAQNFSRTVPGGPWYLIQAAGFDTTLPLKNPSVTSCLPTGSNRTNVTVPAYLGPYANGYVEAWVLWFYSSNGTPSELLLAVENGTVADMGEVAGFNCVPFLAPPALSNTTIGATQAARGAAETPFGAVYLTTHQTSNATFYLAESYSGPRSPPQPTWFVYFAGCDGSNFTDLRTVLNATDGSFESSTVSSSPSYTCGEPRPLRAFYSMTSGTPSVGTSATDSYCRNGDACYSATILPRAGDGMTASNLAFHVEYSMNRTNYTVGSTLGDGISLVGTNGSVLAAGGVPSVAGQPLTVVHWTTGASLLLSAGMVVWVDLGTSTAHAGQYLALVASGVGAYYGQVSALLP
ncbi:MAG: hypothetical protein L3K10_05500 [Thermoplasmata archaeon]|nr:hypothetical protein [Thermoplasmata archaeon]